MLQLRRGESWRASGLQIFPEASTPLQGVAGSALDVTLVLERWGARRSLGSPWGRWGEILIMCLFVLNNSGHA